MGRASETQLQVGENLKGLRSEQPVTDDHYRTCQTLGIQAPSVVSITIVQTQIYMYICSSGVVVNASACLAAAIQVFKKLRPRGSVLGLRQPGLEFCAMCLKGSFS